MINVKPANDRRGKGSSRGAWCFPMWIYFFYAIFIKVKENFQIIVDKIITN